MFTLATDYDYDAKPRRLQKVRLAQCFIMCVQECRDNNAYILPLFKLSFATKQYELNFPQSATINESVDINRKIIFSRKQQLNMWKTSYLHFFLYRSLPSAEVESAVLPNILVSDTSV